MEILRNSNIKLPRRVAVIAAVASLSMTGCGNKSPEERTAAERPASTVAGNTVGGSLNLDPNTVFVTPGEFKFVEAVSGGNEELYKSYPIVDAGWGSGSSDFHTNISKEINRYATEFSAGKNGDEPGLACISFKVPVGTSEIGAVASADRGDLFIMWESEGQRRFDDYDAHLCFNPRSEKNPHSVAVWVNT